MDSAYDTKAIRERFIRDIEIELTLLSTEAGGRATPLLPGYRAGHIILDRSRWIAQFDPQDRDALYPGETGRVYVNFFLNSALLLLRGKLWVGRQFVLDEYRPIGHGVITALLDFDKHVTQVLLERDKDNSPTG